MTVDVRDYLFGYPLFPHVPEPRLSPALYVQSVAVNTIGPVISGTTEVGQTLTCDPGTWAFSPTGYRYQWLRAGAAIPGATASTHVIIEADTGNILRCAVVAENGMGLSDPAVSNGLYIAALDVPTNVVAPIINGVTTVGQSLSCTTGTWLHDPISYAYQWRRGGVDISGATANAYIVNLLDAGLSVTCAVTATNENGPSSPVSSNALVIDGIPVNSVAPVISGTTTVGNTLSCSAGTWSYTPTGYSYQWKRDGVGIGGATNSTYALAVADAGTSITCDVIASNPQGTSTAATSNTLVIDSVGVPVVSVAPVISGTQFVGQTLSCTTGTWTNSPTSYAYQWKRDGVNIGSATLATYLLVTADAGTSITCAVTATNITGASSPSTSNALSITGVPIISVAPVISGTATVGQTLSCTTGTWSGSPSSYAYQWKRDGVNIGSATASTYLLVLADDTTSVTCAVIATNTAGASAASTSNALVIGSGGEPGEAALDFSVDTNSMYFAVLDDPF